MSTVTVSIPEGLKSAILGAQAGPDRWILEALAIEAYREGLISGGKLGEILGLDFYAREEFLASKGLNHELDFVHSNYTGRALGPKFAE